MNFIWLSAEISKTPSYRQLLHWWHYAVTEAVMATTILPNFTQGSGYESVLLWDKQHATRNIRKRKGGCTIFSSLVFIRPIRNEIQLFKDSKITKKYIRRSEGVCGNPRISWQIFKFLNSCILFDLGPIDTNLEIFPDRNVLFLTMWVSYCLSHNTRTRIQPALVWN